MRFFLPLLLFLTYSISAYSAPIGSYEVISKERMGNDKGWNLNIEIKNADGSRSKIIKYKWFDDQKGSTPAETRQIFRDHFKKVLHRLSKREGLHQDKIEQTELDSLEDGQSLSVENEVVQVGWKTVRVNVGETIQARVAYKWLDDSITLPTTGITNITIDDTLIATVNAQGEVTGVSEGQTTISADTPEGSASGTVIVSVG